MVQFVNWRLSFVIWLYTDWIISHCNCWPSTTTERSLGNEEWSGIKSNCQLLPRYGKSWNTCPTFRLFRELPKGLVSESQSTDKAAYYRFLWATGNKRVLGSLLLLQKTWVYHTKNSIAWWPPIWKEKKKNGACSSVPVWEEGRMPEGLGSVSTNLEL